MIPILSNKKALDHDRLIITTSEMGGRTLPIACEGSIGYFMGLLRFTDDCLYVCMSVCFFFLHTTLLGIMVAPQDSYPGSLFCCLSSKQSSFPGTASHRGADAHILPIRSTTPPTHKNTHQPHAHP